MRHTVSVLVEHVKEKSKRHSGISIQTSGKRVYSRDQNESGPEVVIRGAAKYVQGTCGVYVKTVKEYSRKIEEEGPTEESEDQHTSKRKTKKMSVTVMSPGESNIGYGCCRKFRE